jgi:RHS repeat-associated protein
MRYFIFLKKNFLSVVTFLSLFHNGLLFAGTEPVSARISASQIIKNATVFVQDDKYPSSIYPSQLPEVPGASTVVSSLGKVTLSVDFYNKTFIPTTGNIDLKFDLEITSYDKNLNSQVINQSLYVSYNSSNGGFNDKSVYTIDGCHKLNVKILNVYQKSGLIYNLIPDAQIPQNLSLETEIETERYYNFNVNTYLSSNSEIGNTYLSVSNELEIHWNYIPGAEDYDLEWMYVNDYDANGSPTLSTSSINYDFRNNATRVRLTQNYYRISLNFEDGYILYRLRGIGRDLSDPTISYFGKWSSEAASSPATFVSNYPTNMLYHVTEHQKLKNWQYSSVYAEEGKKKEVVSYFDGSLRNRQSVTKLNTENQAVVGETVYDYQGRPAVQVLPTPVQQNMLDFYTNFNQNLANQTYSRNDFDTSSSCNPTANKMSNSSGSSKYYSSSNPDQNKQQNYVPDAGGYPFTQLEYTPDNTGRVLRQGGVGASHQLGSQHETQYFYGQPEQEELDRLFASEVGDFKHYKKNMVVDANGQVSVSYNNMEGKVIATALAGQPPTNLDPLSSVRADNITATYLDATNPVISASSNNTIENNNTLLFSKKFTVEKAGTHSFMYDVIAETFKPACLPANVCYNCVYDLEISVKDLCGQEMIPGGPIIQYIGKLVGNVPTIDTVCSTPIHFQKIPPALDVYLPIGEYIVSKSLRVNDSTADYYVNNYLNQSGCVLSQQHFIDSAKANIDFSGCSVSCDECVASLGNSYEQHILKNPDPATRLTEAQYNLAVKECRKNCEPANACQDLYTMFLADLKPGGQYATYETSTAGVPMVPNDGKHILSILYDNNSLPASIHAGSAVDWRNPKLNFPTVSNSNHYFDDDQVTLSKVYLSLNGSVYTPSIISTASIFVDNLGNSWTYPENLANVSDFINAYKSNPSWANSLVTYHPEYCYYEWCRKNNDSTFTYMSNPISTLYNTSDDFDALIQQTDSYNDAVLLGLIKSATTIQSGVASDINYPFDIYDLDPYWNGLNNSIASQDQNYYGSTSAYYQNLFKDKLNKYLYITGAGTPYYLNIKGMAMTAGVCGSIYYGPQETSAGCSDWNNLNTTDINLLNKVWRIYKDAYLTEKQKIQRTAAHEFAKNCNSTGCGCFNAHIGLKDDWWKYNPYALNFVRYSINCATSWWAWTGWCWYMPDNWGYYDYTQPGSYLTYRLYAYKQKRYVGPDDFINTNGSPQTVINNMLNMAGAAQYQQTGQCPIANQVQSLFNSLCSLGKLAPSTPYNLSSVGEFTKGLYDNITDPSTHPNHPDYDAANYNVSYAWTAAISGSNNEQISFVINPNGTVPPQSSFPGPLCTNLELHALSGDPVPVWSSISGFTNLLYTGQSTVGGQIIYRFKVTAFVNSGVAAVAATTYILYGSTCININDCHNGGDYLDVCNPTELGSELINFVGAMSFISGTGSSYQINGPSSPTGTPSLVNYITPKIQYYLSNTGSEIYSIAATSIMTAPVGYVYEINTSANANNKVRLTLQNTSSASPVLTISPEMFHLIRSIDNIAGSASQPTGNFSATAHVDDDNNPITPNVDYLLNGKGEYTTDGGATYIPIGITKCQNPADALLCSGAEYDLTSDLGDLFAALVPLNCGNSYTNGLTCDHDMTNYPQLTSLLASYISPMQTITPNSVIKWKTLSVSTNTIKGEFISLDQSGNALSDPCTVQFNSNSDLTTLVGVQNFVADETFNDGTGVSYNFKFYDANGIMVTGSTSCLGLKNCPNCPPISPMDETKCGQIFAAEPLASEIGILNSVIVPSPNITIASFCDTYNTCLTQYISYLNTITKSNSLNNLSTLSYTVVTDPLYLSLPDFYSVYSHIPANCLDLYEQYINFFIRANGLTTSQFASSAYYLSLNDFCSYSACSGGFLSGLKGLTRGDGGAIINLPYPYTSLADYSHVHNCTPPPSCSNQPPVTMVPFPSDIVVDPCRDNLISEATSSAMYQYQQYIAQAKENIKKAYIVKCLGAAEIFKRTYIQTEYHYTLYYYDQAGNLVKTVPPAGVNIITDANAITQVKADRLNKQQTVFTTHTLFTEYEYNSLNQLIRQKVPDNNYIQTFQLAGATGLPTGLTVNNVQYSNSSNGYLFGNIGTTGYIFMTNDGGVTWQALTKIGTNDLTKVQLLNATNGFAVGAGGILLKTIDGGQTWEDIPTGVNSNLNDLYFADANNGIIVGDNGVIKKVTYNTGTQLYSCTSVGTIINGNITAISADPTSNFLLNSLGTGAALITVTNPNTVSGTSGTIYESNDNGQTWSLQNTVAVANLQKVRLLNVNTLSGKGFAVGSDGTLLKTADNGLTWQHLATNTNVTFKDVFFADDNNGNAISASGKLLHTINGGLTWTNVTPSSGDVLKTFDFDVTSNDQIGLAVGNGFVLKTIDGGLTWSNITIPNLNYSSVQYISNAGTSYIFLGGASSGGATNLYYATGVPSNTATWNAIALGTTLQSENITAISMKDKDNGVLLTQSGMAIDISAATTLPVTSVQTIPNSIDLKYDPIGSTYYILANNGSMQSSTNGSTWTSFSPGSSGSTSYTSLSINPSNGAQVIVGTLGEILSYVGSTWTNNTNSTTALGLNDIYQADATTAYAVGLNGTVLKGTNMGSTWNFVTFPVSSTTDFNTTKFSLTPDYGLTAGNSDTIIRFTHSGTNLIFAKILSGTSATKTDIGYDPTNTNNVGITCYNNTTISSANGGSSWAVTTNVTSTPGTNLQGISMENIAHLVIVGDNGKILLKNGSVVSNVTDIQPPVLNASQMINSTTGFAVGDNGVIYSTINAGLNWTQHSSPTANNLRGVHFVSTSVGFAVGDNGTLLKTTNGGNTWVSSALLLPSNPNGAIGNLNAIYFEDANNGYIVGNNGYIIYTTNAGTSWAAATTGGIAQNINAIYFINTTGFAVGAGGVILKSIDGAHTFTSLTSSGNNWPNAITGTTSDLHDVYFRDYFIGYTVGDNATLLKTIDGGVTWTNLDPTHQVSGNLNTLGFNNTHSASIAGTNGVFNLNDGTNLSSSYFWYDNLGRIVASQNAKQGVVRTNSASKRYFNYSYTKYDALGRITEVGEGSKIALTAGVDPAVFSPDATTVNNAPFFEATAVLSSTNPNQATGPNHTYQLAQITKNTYDLPSIMVLGFTQDNLRKRLTSSSIDDDGDNVYEYATHYSYDVHSNIKSLLQDNNSLTGTLFNDQRFKRMDYDYDLISGKVNQVAYQAQPDANGDYEADRFYHQYNYDADNRITNVYTSKDGVIWNQDAKYFYYQHGPLARVEIGDNKVQGMDYAYTIQGWIKLVNASTIDPTRDGGKDGLPGTNYDMNQIDLHANIGKDAYGFSLGYFANDYTAVNTALAYNGMTANLGSTGVNTFGGSANDLFDGNVRQMITSLTKPDGTELPVQGMAYKYDQLQRITQMQAYRDLAASSTSDLVAQNNNFTAAASDNSYMENYSYDANGNILNLLRNGNSGSLAMDKLSYQYDYLDPLDHTKGLRSNKLYLVNDAIGANGYTTDIKDQGVFSPALPNNLSSVNTTNNYGYDELGNLNRDKQEEISNIDWSVQGKMRKLVRISTSTKPDLEFKYDAKGNRIVKIVKPHGTSIENGGANDPSQWTTIHYLRDTKGNVLTTYEDRANSIGGNGFYLKEQNLFGDKRLGVLNRSGENIDVNTQSTLPNIFTGLVGRKMYEQSNHLGNVLSTVSDYKKPIAGTLNPTLIAYYLPEVKSTSDYYAFGAPLPGRQFNATDYRYGFNGKENDRETIATGEGTQDYGMRIYNPSLGKYLSLDPLSANYPELTPYQFASNRPIQGIDKDGEEFQNMASQWMVWNKGCSALPIIPISAGMGDVQVQVYTLKVMGDAKSFAKLKETYTTHPEQIHNKNNPYAQYSPRNTVVQHHGNVAYTDPILEKGDHMFIEIKGPGDDSWVRFTNITVTENSFKIEAATLYGHVDAGTISFSGVLNPETGEITFSIINITRENNGAATYKNIGRIAQVAQWKLVLNNVEEFIGGKTVSKMSGIDTYNWDDDKNTFGKRTNRVITDLIKNISTCIPAKTPQDIINILPTPIQD